MESVEQKIQSNFTSHIPNTMLSSEKYLHFSVGKEKFGLPLSVFLDVRHRFVIDYKKEKNSVNYIGSSKTDEQKISIFYGALVDLNKECFLNESLSKFDSNLLFLKQKATERGVVLKIQKKSRDFPVLLSSLGDGISRYIAILCAIWASENGVLLIDEIENGIHYSNYPKLWKLIFQAAKYANCQIFITSHSKECIQAFNEFQLKTDSKDEFEKGLYIELFKNQKTELISASVRDAEQLKYALTHEGSIRGE